MEKMKPRMVKGENKPYWLLICFHDNAFVHNGEGSVNAANSLTLWRPGSSFEYGNPEKEWTHTWFVFRGAEISELLDDFPAKNGVPFACEDEHAVVSIAGILYYDMMEKRPELSQLRLLELLLNRIRFDRNTGPNQVPSRLRHVEQYLQENFQTDVSLGRLSEISGMSCSCLRMSFERYYGMPPSKYILKIRMNRAAILLNQRYLSCKETALLTGFRNQLYFSRVFRKFYGMPPSVFAKGRRCQALDTP